MKTEIQFLTKILAETHCFIEIPTNNEEHKVMARIFIEILNKRLKEITDDKLQ
jgi:hypothetical protein